MCILRYTPSSAAVGVDDRGGVAIDAGAPAARRSARSSTTASSFASACIASVVGPGNRLGEVEPLALLRLAEVRRVEQLLQADDLRAAAGGLADQPLRPARGSPPASAVAWSWMMPMVNGGEVAARSMVTPPLSAIRPGCPVLNTASCDVERTARFGARKSLKGLSRSGTALGLADGVDRPLPPEVERQDRLRRVLKIGVPIVLLALVLAALPGWIRPSVSRSRIRTARVTTGPIEAVITASGTVVAGSRAGALEPARRPRAADPQAARARTSSAATPVVELDTSESVLALDKVVKDLKIKDNQQAQTRLTLEKSLVDLDGRLEVKTLELQSAQARLEGDQQLFKEGLLSREALRRSELAVKQAQIELTQLREERGQRRARHRRAARGAVARARLARQGSGAGAAAARPLDHQIGSRRRADLGAVAGRRAGAARRRHRAHRRPVVVPRRRHRLRRPRRPAAHRHAGGRPRQRRSTWPGTVTDVFPTVENGVLRFTVALAEPSHAGPATEPARRRARRSPTASRARCGSSAARSPTTPPARRSWSAAIARCACRSQLGLAGVDDVEVVSGVSRRRRVIISDMQDYLHLSEVRIK